MSKKKSKANLRFEAVDFENLIDTPEHEHADLVRIAEVANNKLIAWGIDSCKLCTTCQTLLIDFIGAKNEQEEE